MLKMKIRIVHGIPRHRPGEIVVVDAVAEGVPKDLYWMRRLRDSKVDGCIELVSEAKKKRKSVDVPVTDGGNE